MDKIDETIVIDGLLKEILLASITSCLDIDRSISNVRAFNKKLLTDNKINKHSDLRIIEIIKGKTLKSGSVFDVNKALENGASPQEIANSDSDIFTED